MEAAIAERVEQFLAAVAAEEGGPPGAPNGIDVHQELTELILDGRSIRSISGLASLANLPCMSGVRTLEATDNHITTGLDLLVKAFPNLRKLQLGGNHIKTFADLEPLAHLTQLEQLGLDLNPVASQQDYREKVFALVPSLLVLDSRDRQGEEREPADSDSEEEEEDEAEEVDTTLKDFYETEMPEQDAEDAEDFEPPCEADEDEEMEDEEDIEEEDDEIEGNIAEELETGKRKGEEHAAEAVSKIPKLN